MRLKYIIALVVIFCATLVPGRVLSQQFSYVYIQGDKQTPFYVKLEGEMQPRYGKNYSIISQLAPGTINIEILFQQNIFPPQHFAVKVPEKGSRAFLLSKKGNSFSLYDLQQQFYINAGNAASDDHVPTYNPGDNYVATNNQAPAAPVTAGNNAYNNTYTQTDERTTPTGNKGTAQPKEPQFIDNVELNNERTIQATAIPVEEDNRNAETYTEPAIPKNVSPRNTPTTNSDCPQPIMDNAFQDIYSRMGSKNDKTRLKYLLSRLDNCFTTAQIRMLAKGLGNDPERYAFLKQAYPRITDQGNFASLENLLTTREWKDYFRLIMP